MGSMDVEISWKKALIFFCIVAMLPFMTNCGKISIGFPTVVYSWETHQFSILATIINLLFIAIFLLLFVYLYKLKQEDRSMKIAVFAVIWYHVVYIITFLSLELIDHFHNYSLEVIKNVLGGIFFVLQWPFLLLLYMNKTNSPWLIPHALYGDSFDLLIRLSYLVSVITFFVATYWIARYFTRRQSEKKKK